MPKRMPASTGSRDLEAAPHRRERPRSPATEKASAEDVKLRLVSMFESERVDMGIVGNEENFAKRHDRFAEVHPVGNLFFTGVELSPGLRIEREKREVIDRSGAILGGEGIVVDFVLRAVNVGRALDRLPLLSGWQIGPRWPRRADQARACRERSIAAGALLCRPGRQPGRARMLPLGAAPPLAFELWRVFRRRSPDGDIQEALAVGCFQRW